jgi:hypothetical protein
MKTRNLFTEYGWGVPPPNNTQKSAGWPRSRGPQRQVFVAGVESEVEGPAFAFCSRVPHPCRVLCGKGGNAQTSSSRKKQ